MEQIKNAEDVNRMGAWGTSVFENDSACDFILNVENSPTVITDELVRIREIVEEEDYLEVDEGSSVLAMAELVLNSFGVNPIHEIAKKIDFTLIKETVALTFLNQLISLLELVLDVDNNNRSELFELWEEADPKDFAEWKNISFDLLEGIKKIRDEQFAN
jgi:hypothetical protein